MKKSFNILLATIIAFFTVPLTGHTVMADASESSFEPDEAYTIEYVTDSQATKTYFNNPVTLLLKNDKQYIQMSGTGGQFIESLTVNETEVTWGERNDDGTFTIQFEVDGVLSDEIDFGMVIDIGRPDADPMEHIVPLSFNEGTKQVTTTEDNMLLPKNNVSEHPDSEEADSKNNGEPNNEEESDSSNSGEPNSEEKTDSVDASESNNEQETEPGNTSEPSDNEKNVSGSQNESNDDAEKGSDESSNDTASELVPEEAYTLDYSTDTPMIERYFDNPVTLLLKDGQKYIQISGNSGQFIKTLTINGNEVTRGETNEDGTYIMQFELEGSLSDKLDFGMVIDTDSALGEMTHSVSLEFDEDTKQTADINKYMLLPIDDDSEDTGKQSGEPKNTGSSISQSSTTDETEPGNESDNESANNEPTNDNNIALTPDKAFTINYDIKQTDEITDSVSNDFFEKPALLFEKDGNKYVQITITEGEVVKELSNKYGLVLLVQENEDGSIIVQFKVDDDLSNMKLNMHIVVPETPDFPGYDEEHEAYIVFYKDSIEEISVGDYTLAGVNDPDNKNGPFVEDGESGTNTLGSDTPEKPELGPSQDNNGSNDQNGGTAGQETNPKTGDTTSIMLYALLLIGSAIPLAIQLKRRFI